MGDIENPIEAVQEAVGGVLGGAADAIKEEFGFGGEQEVADNQEVTEQSGCERFCSSLICALVIGPLFMLGGAICAGVNEKNYLCTSRAIDEGFGEVVKVNDCQAAEEGSGSLILFTCDLDLTSGKVFTPFPNDQQTYNGTGLYTQVEMFQCVEVATSKSKTKAGAKKKTTTTYTYKKEWRSSYVNSANFKKKDSEAFRTGCGAGSENPTWTDLPTPGTQRASSVKVGAFKVGSDFVSYIKLQKQLTDFQPPSGWTLDGNYYMKRAGAPTTPAATGSNASVATTTPAATTGASSGGEQIGDVRVQFKGDDPAAVAYTVLGKNSGAAAGIGKWTASDSWGCSGFKLGSMKQGEYEEEEFQKSLESSNTALLYFLRFLAFALIWFGMSRCAEPCEVVAECLPFIGGFVGDMVEVIACVATCCPALACCFGVASIVYVAMRPALGIPMMLFFIITACAFGFWKYKKEEKKKNEAMNPTGSGIHAATRRSTDKE